MGHTEPLGTGPNNALLLAWMSSGGSSELTPLAMPLQAAQAALEARARQLSSSLASAEQQVAAGQEAAVQQRGELQSLREQLQRLQQLLQQCQADLESSRSDAQRWGPAWGCAVVLLDSGAVGST
jgi:hypothetical protein